MNYSQRRLLIRQKRKEVLLLVMRQAEEDGEMLGPNELADRTGCPRTTFRVLQQEMVDEGLIPGKVIKPRDPEDPGDLAARIAVVREAKLRRFHRCGRMGLSRAKLDKVLPI